MPLSRGDLASEASQGSIHSRIPWPAMLGGSGFVLGCLAGEAAAAPLWSLPAIGLKELGPMAAVRWVAAALCLAMVWGRLRQPLRWPTQVRWRALILVCAGLAAGACFATAAAARLAQSPYRNLALSGDQRNVLMSGVVTGVASLRGDNLVVPVRATHLAGQRIGARLELLVAGFWPEAIAGPDGGQSRPARPRPGDLITWDGEAYLPQPQLNPYEYDARRALARSYLAARVRVAQWTSAGEAQILRRWTWGLLLTPLRLADALRWRLYRVFSESLADPAKGLMQAFVLGDRAGMTTGVRAAFEATGSLHLAAVSGLHVGLAAVGTNGLLSRLTHNSRVARAGTSAVVLLFVLLTGAAAPVTRASIALAITAWPPRARKGNGLNTLAVAASLLCLRSPLVAGDASFQLSFGAALAIISSATAGGAGTGGRRRESSQVLIRLARMFKTSMAAQAATLPVVLHNFGRLCPYAALNNLILLPLGSFVIMVYLAGALVALVSPQAFAVLAPAMAAVSWLLLWPAQLLGRLPGSLWAPGHPGTPLIVVGGVVIPLALVAMAINARASSGRLRCHLSISVVCLVLLLLAAPLIVHRPPSSLTLSFFAVGQGDAALVRLGGAAVLIDLGPPAPDGSLTNSPFARRVMPFLWATRVRPTLAILSHPHADHVGGLADALTYLPALQALTRQDFLAQTLQALTPATCHSQTIGIAQHSRLALPAGRSAAGRSLVLELFWAPLDDLNEGSVAVRIVGDPAGAMALFAGDAGFAAEQAWLRAVPSLLPADVLKVGHHGSAGSSGEQFLAKVSAQVAIIPVGANRFGHPSPAALARLEAQVPLVLRTDQVGYIAIRTGQQGLEVHAWRQHARHRDLTH